ncbi:MAG: DDE-type integrase/transposase/recombinase [Terriglobales bacterium]
MPHDLRDVVVDFLNHYRSLTGIALVRLLIWLGLSPRKFNRWKDRYGKANEHNAMIPRDHWIEPEERAAIVEFARAYPLEGYRRLAFMMLDRDVAAVSPATTYRVLKEAGVIGARPVAPSRKGRGFVQPLQPHEHWHVDFSYVNIGGTFYYLCSVLDGASRAILSWDIRPQMKETDAEIVIQRAREAFPDARPRVITDNGPQFIAREFQEFIRLWQTTHVFTSPHYPQSNGKLERYHRTLKEQAIRPKTPLTLEDARRIVGDFVDHYNAVRLHAGIGYIAPNNRLAGRHTAIFAARDKKLETARENRRIKRQKSTAHVA